MGDADDIPPLDDMSSLVDQIKEKKKANQSLQSNSVGVATNSVDDFTAPSPAVKKSNVGYGGMRKGFLFGNSSKQSTTGKSKVITTTKVDYEVKPTVKKNNNLIFNEVQEAVKDNQGILGNEEWVTDDLLNYIQGNEKLLKKLSEPKFSKAVDMMQKDPKAAMEYYKDQKDIQEFFVEFYKILGQHFTTLGKQTASSRTVPPVQKSTEEQEFEKIISRPEIRDILEKPGIKKLLTVLKTSPQEGQHVFRSASDEIKADVKKLVDAGLLNFEAPPKQR